MTPGTPRAAGRGVVGHVRLRGGDYRELADNTRTRPEYRTIGATRWNITSRHKGDQNVIAIVWPFLWAPYQRGLQASQLLRRLHPVTLTRERKRNDFRLDNARGFTKTRRSLSKTELAPYLFESEQYLFDTRRICNDARLLPIISPLKSTRLLLRLLVQFLLHFERYRGSRKIRHVSYWKVGVLKPNCFNRRTKSCSRELFSWDCVPDFSRTTIFWWGWSQSQVIL